ARAAAALAWLVAGCGGGTTPPPEDTLEPPTDTVEDVEDVPGDTAVPTDTNLCAPDSLFCVSPREAGVCNATGDGAASVTSCNGATACEPSTGLCRPTICEPDKQLCLNLADYQVCNPDGSGWSETRQCPSERFCADGACRACQANRVECLSETTYRACPADSSAWSEETPCGEGERCISGACEPCDLATECLAGEKLRTWCQNPNVDFDETVACEPGLTCMDGGCYACPPDTLECQDETTYRQCRADGLAWVDGQSCDADEVCFEGACQYYGCVPRVLFLVDRSGSMSGNWQSVKGVISALVQANPSVRFGLKSFPSSGSTCGVHDGIDVPFAQGLAHTFELWFDNNGATGATPLVAGLEVLRDQASEIFGAFGGAIIVLSDGDDTCFTGNIKIALAVAASSLLVDHAVGSYVVGYNFAGDEEALNEIAKNGGTTLSSYIPADDPEQLLEAFQLVVDDAKVCEE
ncbi:MAG: VWA domain-containing protein, partial [Deltaproteobacteria bacterium]